MASFTTLCLVLGKCSNEITALRLVTAYCLPALLYGCEAWQWLWPHKSYFMHKVLTLSAIIALGSLKQMSIEFCDDLHIASFAKNRLTENSVI